MLGLTSVLLALLKRETFFLLNHKKLKQLGALGHSKVNQRFYQDCKNSHAWAIMDA